MQPNSLLLVFALLITALGAVLLFAALRLGVAARRTRRRALETPDESVLLTEALGEAVERIRQQERETHARAEASERLSEQIIDSLASGLLVVDVAGAVQILNPAARRLLGVTAAEPTGPFRDLIGVLAAPLADVIDECVSTKLAIPRSTIRLLSGHAGTAAHLGGSVSPMRGDDGRFQGVICLFTDLSAVIDLEERLRLQDSLARVGELTAGIAHEFRNGLATIHGYSRLLDPQELQTEYKAYVEGIREETVALREVVDNFLNFARPAELILGKVSLRKLVERAAEEIRKDARASGGDVHVRGEFPDVEGDEVLLRQALSNLCRNAIDACLGGDDAPRIVLEGTIDLDHGEARITVTDNGHGIDPEQRARIFRPFFTTKTGGTGLGLALTQKIIVTHNGRVTAAAAEGGGARMEVALPIEVESRRVG